MDVAPQRRHVRCSPWRSPSDAERQVRGMPEGGVEPSTLDVGRHALGAGCGTRSTLQAAASPSGPPLRLGARAFGLPGTPGPCSNRLNSSVAQPLGGGRPGCSAMTNGEKPKCSAMTTACSCPHTRPAGRMQLVQITARRSRDTSQPLGKARVLRVSASRSGQMQLERRKRQTLVASVA